MFATLRTLITVALRVLTLDKLRKSAAWAVFVWKVKALDDKVKYAVGVAVLLAAVWYVLG